MRRVAEGVYVAGSRYWQVNTGVVVASGRAIVIDAGVFPDELLALAAELRALDLVVGVSTHEHWDHVLWSSDLGAGVPRLASAATARAVREQRDELLALIITEQRAHDVCWDHDLIARLQPVPFGLLHVDGPAMELCDLGGHTPGHAGVWVPQGRVAFVGDTVSDIDPPALPETASGVRQYVDTLDRLQELIAAADVVVPGHGQACGRDEAQRRLDADRRYLDVAADAVHARPERSAHLLSEDTAVSLDDMRLRSATGWSIHLDNLAVLLAGNPFG